MDFSSLLKAPGGPTSPPPVAQPNMASVGPTSNHQRASVGPTFNNVSVGAPLGGALLIIALVVLALGGLWLLLG